MIGNDRVREPTQEEWDEMRQSQKQHFQEVVNRHFEAVQKSLGIHKEDDQ